MSDSSDSCDSPDSRSHEAVEGGGSSNGGTGIISSSTFASLNVVPKLASAAKAMGWEYATTIQEKCIPPAIEGRDVIGLAETGSGKTGSFAIPILQRLLEQPQRLFAVVLSPTRELAFQIHEVFEGLGKHVGCNSVCIVGGIDMMSQAIALARNPHIIVATPGRLVDHLENTKGFNLRQLKYLVMDEADRMLSMDFEEELNKILDEIPDSTAGRRTMLFSATMTSKVNKLQRASLSDPIKVEVSTKFQVRSSLYRYYISIRSFFRSLVRSFPHSLVRCSARAVVSKSIFSYPPSLSRPPLAQSPCG